MNRVTCNAHDCRWWATAFTTLADNPKPWPEAEYPTGGTYQVMPLWYACPKHRTPKHTPIPEGDKPPVCERCGKTEGVEWVGGGTAYHYVPTTWDIIRYGPGGLDPNRDCPYCPDCAEDYRSYWNEMWSDYRSSIGI